MTSSSFRSRGFTLIELLAVVVILLILLALLLPAMQTTRGPSHRNTCANNLRQIAISLTNYESNHRAYPGYANVVGGKRASWVVPILPYIERADLYTLWKDTAPVTTFPVGSDGTQLATLPRSPNPWAHTRLHILECPSANHDDDATNPSSIVANCGSARSANDLLPPINDNRRWVEDINSGVFFNHARADFAQEQQSNPFPPKDAFAPADGPAMSAKFIARHDGNTMTKLLSENLQATNWATDPTALKDAALTPFQSEFQIKQNLGFVWFVTGNVNNTTPPVRGVLDARLYSPSSMAINAFSKSLTLPLRVAYSDTDAPKGTGGLAASRPSSAHPGGVHVTFCDGHLRFIPDDIDYKVYTELMTSNGRAAIVSMGPPAVTAKEAKWDYRLREDDYNH